MLNNKGQVTIFVIFGLVLLAIVIIILSSSRTEEIEFDEPILNLINFQVKSCFDTLTKINRSIIINQGGFMQEGLYPSNILIYKDQVFLTSYDRYNDATHLESNIKLNFANDMLEFLRNEFEYCITTPLDMINEEYQEQIDEFTIDIFSIYLEQDVFLIDYEYAVIINGQEFEQDNFYTFNIEDTRIVTLADEFTQRFFESYHQPDIFFNMNMCEELFMIEGIKPRYTLDFLKFYEEYGITGIIFEEDFFIINSQYEGLIFNYAIRPELIDSIC